MKASIYRKYGKEDQIFVEDIKNPIIKDDKVIVKVHAASINQADAYILQGKPFPLRFITGLFKPKHQTLGSDIAGVITEVGKDVSDFNVGDEVFGQLVIGDYGGYSEYALIAPKLITKKPENITFSEAASVSMAALTAVQGLRLGEVKEGSKILIYGASGGVGTFFIQIAKALGAHVTAVCSTRNIEVAKESGADIIIDYTKEQWNKRNVQYDSVFGVNGYNKITTYRDALTDSGIYVSVGGAMKQIFEVNLKAPFMKKKMNRSFKDYVSKVTKEDLDIIAKYLKEGKIKPYVDKEFPLDKIREAFNHFMNGKTIGKTVVKIEE